MKASDFKVNLLGLSQKAHRFDYELDDEFFKLYGNSLLEGGRFSAEINLDKRETLIEANFHIRGEARLVCDRSLEPFDHPLDIHRRIMFKYGQEEKELSEDIVLITHTQASLDIGQYIFEIIVVSVPMKRLHPNFKNKELEESEIQLVYSSPVDSTKEEDTIDPRWEKLKKLK